MILKIVACLVFVFSIFSNSLLFAGAAVQKQQQLKAAQQQAQQAQEQAYVQAYQQAQQQAYAQAVAQQQQQAYAQAVAQQQAAEIQAARQYVMAQQAQLMIQAQINRVIQVRQLEVAQQAQLKQAVEQELARRISQQILQGQVQQVQQAMVSQVVEEQAQRVAQQQVAQVVNAVGQVRAAQTLVAANAIAHRNDASNDMVQDIVDINALWAQLDISSKAWTLIIDTQAKVMTVNEYIERYRKEGIRILKPPASYAQMIDDLAAQNPQMLIKPFKEILQLVAIMEYDFDNGLDKDMMARKLLGEDFYQKNRKRLGK